MDLEGFSVELYANALTKRDRKEQLCKERMMSIVNSRRAWIIKIMKNLCDRRTAPSTLIEVALTERL